MWRRRSYIFEIMGFKRSKRVGDRIKEEVSDLLLRRVKDPRIGFVTITDVDVTNNLRLAKVYYSVMGSEEDRRRAAEGLASALGFIKRELGARLHLKYMPDVVFCYDPSLEYGERIEQILRDIKGRID
jgi:ribosome-binding factor A